MNDHEAIDAIYQLFEDWLSDDLSDIDFTVRVSYILGLNRFEHVKVQATR